MNKKDANLRRRGERGIALIIALICLAVVSVLALGVMFSTQAEIWTSSSYRATTQARYIAEAGAQQALNFLATNYTQVPASLVLTTYPVTTSTGGPVIMATSGSRYTDTYGAVDSSMKTTFDNYFGSGTTTNLAPFSTAINPGARFDVAVQLLSAKQGANSQWLMRWKVISQGSLSQVGASSFGTGSGSGKAMVQIVEVVDNVLIPSGTSSGGGPTYIAGVFATSTGCGAISMSGGQYTNSYNSATQLGSASPSMNNSGGDVATLGNISVTNGAYIIGSVFTPHYNQGAAGTYGISGGPWPGLNSSAGCSTATGGTEYAVNEDNSGSGVGCTGRSSSSCSQKTYPMPTPLPTYPTPIMPTVAANTSACTGYNGLCSGGSGGGSGCAITIPPSVNPDGTSGTGAANFGAVNFGSCSRITLQPGTYNMDSLLLSNGGQIIMPSSGKVVINILDNGSTSTPLNVNGGTVANNGGDPVNLTFAYAGAKPIYLAAGANMFASVYAPNSAATINGNAGLYGALVSKSATFQGSGHVIYDTHLGGQSWNVNTGTPSFVPGAVHVDEFSWSAF